MVVKQLEGVAQDRAGHVEDHVAERAFGFQRVASVQGRDIPRQTDLGSALDQGDARFRPAVHRRRRRCWQSRSQVVDRD